MKHVVNHQVVLPQAPEGPLVAWLNGFAETLGNQGYVSGSISERVRLAADFSRWLGQEGIDPGSIGPDHPARYLRDRAQHQAAKPGDRSALRHFLDYLRVEQAIPAETVPTGPETEIQRCLREYGDYLRGERGLYPTTIQAYTSFARDFLEHRFDTGPVTLPDLRADDAVGFVRLMAPGMNRGSAKGMTSALRSFLRYVRYREEGVPDLAAAVPTVADWAMTSIPRAIGADQTERLLASIDRTTPTGRRDYAILLLFARLGLRQSEVALLELDDIDWRTATLHVRTKGGGRNDYPLSHEVGEAIADYLRHGRPAIDSRRVFLRVAAPIGEFRSPGGVSGVIRRLIQRAGMDTPTKGTHQFRHGLAVRMMRHGASLAEIGDVLGHRRPDTTRIYAKVDLDALRRLALPWPGGAR